MKQARHVHLLAHVSGALRTAKFEDREHVVVPVVALVEGVIHAANAEFPELVLADELSKAPQGWDGRPVLPDHPARDGQRISANDPRILEEMAFGRVFNSKIEGKRLLVEAWLDRERAGKLGGDAQRTLERVEAGELVEVSVGAFVVAEEKRGVHHGQRFMAIWREIVPDHLAMLPEGVIGACSAEMGCGAPRVAHVYQVLGDRYLRVSSQEAEVKRLTKQETREQVLTVLEGPPDMGDQDLRGALDAALRASEPGFLGVDTVFPNERQVVYAVAPTEALVLFRRDFKVDGDGAITLSTDKTEVRPVMRFEPVGEPTTASAGCGCRAKNKTPAKEENVNKKDLVKAILAKKGTPFVEADATVLEGFSEERLTALAAEEPVKELEPEPVQASEETPEQRRKKLLDENPDIASVLEEDKKARAAKRVTLMDAMAASGQKSFTEAELGAMPLDQLEKVVGLLPAKQVVDRTLLGPRALVNETEEIPAAPDLHEAIRAARSAGR